MKMLTTFAAVAALIAGISVASAQSSTMNKSGAMGSSSTHVTGTGKFCVKGISGALNCQFASLSACQKAAKGSETCSANPKSGTTGAK
jgi:hypothetical protein